MSTDPEDIDFPLNGLSIHSLNINQGGDLEIEFDLPCEQTTDRWQTTKRGSRVFDVYEDEEMQELVQQLFDVVRDRVREPDPERVEIHCDQCKTSSCCRKYNVLVKPSDVERLATGFGISVEEVERRYLDDGVDWCEDYEYQLKCDDDEEGEEKCLFLKENDLGQMRCSIYEFRPEICRSFDMKTCDDFVALEDVTVL